LALIGLLDQKPKRQKSKNQKKQEPESQDRKSNSVAARRFGRP
jgi:hypothetical protein